jgi:type IV secretion system protein VirB8
MGKSGKRTVKVLSVSKLNDSTSQIRFSTQDWFNGTARAPQFWVAIATYHFVSTPKTLDDRLENPLGFTVDGYRVDQESSMPTDINNEASQ